MPLILHLFQPPWPVRARFECCGGPVVGLPASPALLCPQAPAEAARLGAHRDSPQPQRDGVFSRDLNAWHIISEPAFLPTDQAAASVPLQHPSEPTGLGPWLQAAVSPRLGQPQPVAWAAGGLSWTGTQPFLCTQNRESLLPCRPRARGHGVKTLSDFKHSSFHPRPPSLSI